MFYRLMNQVDAKKLVPPVIPSKDDICVIIYTSGTSGRPKVREITAEA